MPERGRAIVFGIDIYLLAKAVLNLFLGHFAFSNWSSLVFQLVFAAVLISGVKYANYVIAGMIFLIAFWYLPGNISGLPGSIVYLAEAVADFSAVGILTLSGDVRAFFGNDQKF